MQNKIERFQDFEYDGTLEGFNLLVNRLGLKGEWPYKIRFLNSDYNETSIFTGIIEFNEIRLILKKGDWYRVKIED